MGSPYDIDYIVKPEDGRVCFNNRWYEPGQCIRLKPSEIGCFMDLELPSDPVSCCFPEYCVTDGGYPTDGYRNTITVPAGGTAIAVVPSIEGCAPPGTVTFNYCPSSCIYVGYNADPVVAGEVNDGTAGDPSPTIRDLNEGAQVETIHFNNPGGSDVLVVMSFYC